METCDTFRYWISLNADSRLHAGLRRGLSVHLAECTSCRGFERLLDQGKARLKGDGVTDPGEAFTREVLKAAKRSPAMKRSAWVVPAWAAAGVIAVAAPFFLIQHRQTGPAPEESARSIQDRVWLLFSQFANGRLETSHQDQLALREELAESGLSQSLPDSLMVAGVYLDRLRHIADAASPLADEFTQLRLDIRSSGLLVSWRPRGPVAASPASLSTPGQPGPFRQARSLLYAGAGDRALPFFHESLASDLDPDRCDDALYWIAFIESRRGREAEALGALQSLLALETEWLDPSTLDEAQRLAMALGERVGAERVPIPVWSPLEPGKAPEWTSINISPDEAWCAFEVARGNRGGKESPVSLVFRGTSYGAGNLEEFRSRYPEVFRYLETRMPAIAKFLEEGVAEIEVPMPVPPGP